MKFRHTLEVVYIAGGIYGVVTGMYLAAITASIGLACLIYAGDGI